METFLKIPNSLFGLAEEQKITPVEILIVAKVREFETNKCTCYMTDEQLAEMFGSSTRTISRSIEDLCGKEILAKTTKFIKGNGKANRQRILRLGKAYNGNSNIDGSLCSSQNDKSITEVTNCDEQDTSIHPMFNF